MIRLSLYFLLIFAKKILYSKNIFIQMDSNFISGIAILIAVNNNIPTLVVFPIFILYQIYWSWKNGCTSILYSLLSLILGGGLGALFSYAIDKSGIVQLQYFNGITKQDVCIRATNAKYKCSTKPNV